VRFRKDFTGDDTRITIPELKLRWDHEFSRDDYGVHASFTGRPASSFKVTPDRADRDRLVTGFSVTHQKTSNLFFYLAYEHTLSPSETLHTGELGMKYSW
jgi:outer membrane autotransporter protein